jgi:Lectin C-type domain
MRGGFAHWLRTMVQRAGSEEAKAAGAGLGAEDGTQVEPKDAWTPVTAEEADRVVRALVAGAPADGGHRDSASPMSGAVGEAAHATTRHGAVRKSRARTVIGGVVAVAVVAGAARWLVSQGNPAPSASAGASLRDSGPPGGASFAQPGTAPGHEQDSGMNRSAAAALVAGVAGLAIAGGAGAQNAAVQWKVSDGGNGHWYKIVSLAGTGKVYWSTCRDSAMSVGGDLACFTSEAETSAFIGLTAGQTRGNPWIGLFQDHSAPDFSEPRGGWRWCSGEPLAWTNWAPGEPNNAGNEDWANMWISYGPPGTWNDYQPTNPQGPDGYVIEWSADCNGDGIVDYGQCHDGTLPDYNGNNIPDCCERGEACVVGNYPVQWRVEEGGNGHWYCADRTMRQWDDANRLALAKGASLATLSDAEEERLCVKIAVVAPSDYWLAAKRDVPAGSFRWTTGEPFTYSDWLPGQPDDYRGDGCYPNGELWLELAVRPPLPIGWNDEGYVCGPGNGSLLEWSADCNQDNIVDYGQILTGQLADANANGVPDLCEVPTCRDVDLFRDDVVNGADLGILLAQWGPANSRTVSDINHDGQVNGSDLGTLLAFWGACTN